MPETDTKKLRPRFRLNQSKVDAENRPGIYKDDKLTGFGLRISPLGKKVYFVESKVRGYRDGVIVTIGPADRWRAEAARLEAQSLLNEMSQGINPNKKRRDEAERSQLEIADKELQKKSKTITVAKVFEDYKHSNINLKENTKKIYTYVVNSRLKDWLDLPIAEITSDMVASKHRKISETHKGDANHAMRILRALCEFAKDRYRNHLGQPILNENPVRVLRKSWNKLERRQTVIKSHQIKAWYDAVLKLENDSVRDYLLMLLFTGLRKNEGSRLEWKVVDLKARTVLISDTKNKEDLLLPLPQNLFAMLKKREGTSQSIYVYPGPSGHLKDIRYHMQYVIESCGVNFTLHDLRRTFATFAFQLCTHYEVKRLMNHKDGADVTSGYIIADVENLRSPMQKIEDAIRTSAGLKKATRKSK